MTLGNERFAGTLSKPEAAVNAAIKEAAHVLRPQWARHYSAVVTQALADLFAADADAGVLRVLQDAGKPLSAAEVKQALSAAGVTKAAADKAWPAVQKRLKSHGQVAVDGTRYRWAQENPDQQEPDQLKPDPEKPDPETAARQRQAEIDGVRLLAELASEVEELIANETEPAVLIRQVRAWVKRSGLNPVGRAGEETRFDRKIHRPIGGPIGDGAMVIVVRPGYIWKTSDQDLLIGKAVVEE